MLTWDRLIPGGDRSLVNSEVTEDSAAVPGLHTEGTTGDEVNNGQDTTPRACPSCMNTGKLTHICKKCGVAAYCDLDCYHSDWHQHKFSCNLGRPIDSTDYLVLACHSNEFPQEDDVAKEYGFMCFASGLKRSRLFQLYRLLIINCQIDEEELRSAVKLNKLKEMLTNRCLQTGNPDMLSHMHWLESEEEFRANGKGSGFSTDFDAAREELLSTDDRRLPISELRPREKLQALLFYFQIRNWFRPDVDEDNWISLGFCTAADPESDQQLAFAYGLLVERCPFDEFWKAMAESRIVELFSRYGLAERILHMRNFKDFMGIVKTMHQSVWELKRFIRMNMPDPLRAVVVDYGFMNCANPHERLQLRSLYQEFFERGEDEIRLHEACIAGQLASYLESVFGSLVVPRNLLSNTYPLENYPLMGMVADTVIMCPESALDQVKALKKDGQEAIYLTVPDDRDEASITMLHDRAAFLGTGLRKRIYSGSDGKVIKEFVSY